jgi:RNA polymerase sigma-70 factor (ECF subfamily)
MTLQRTIAPKSVGLAWLARLVGEARGAAPGGARANAAGSAVTDGGTGELESSFELFVRAHERQILNYLWRVTGDEQAAYDLAQETFLRAWKHYASVSRYEQPGGWLFRVATNLALSHKRARQRRIDADATRFDGDPSPITSDVARRVIERDEVREVLQQLPAKRRAALVLREVYGLSMAEIAAALGISEPAVRMALSRAREQFRALYRSGGEGLR